MSQGLIKDIQAGGHKKLQELYQQYRTPFLRWAMRRYRCTEHLADDVFQEAMIALYENIRKGKLTKLSSSVKTYIFAVGKNLLLGRLKSKHHQTLTTDEFPLHEQDTAIGPLEKLKLNDRAEALAEALDQLGEPCSTLLRLFYYHRYSMEAIARELNYSSDNVAKVQKVRCLNRLREIVDPKKL